jgi:hypothetical protein
MRSADRGKQQRIRLRGNNAVKAWVDGHGVRVKMSACGAEQKARLRKHRRKETLLCSPFGKTPVPSRTNRMDLRDLSQKIENELIKLFEELRSGIAAREDSRAFGAMIEHRIKQNWEAICSRNDFVPVDLPGRRTIFDFGLKAEERIVGIDVKTKDLDTTKYSDGGICAVGNLLKFLANDRGQFIIAEFGHNRSAEGSDTRDLEYIRVAPFTLLPTNAYRIENLGTGQVRLNYTINQVWDEIEWGRDMNQFYDFFTDLAIKHYQRVGRDALRRIESIEAFKQSGYAKFQFSR